MGKVKLLLDVIGDLRSLADSLQAVADAVADSGAAEADEKPGTDPITSASGVFGAVFGNFSLERSVSPKAGTGTDRTAQFDFHRL